ncbi:MAG TPA: RagB/SusD family nutrient uptake outer membrane protein [Saprospiraceae bacterium]|nr:RagB/SusD family nutrient uptake outer membrane protein [Saprospiraceae bacterium]HMQ83048.1 RagB/SusD family nutrient uptake outer membrane protein [Saprospiraceae bacterium]
MKKYLFIIAGLALVMSACTIDEQFDPNNPDVGSFLSNAEAGELDLLVYGATARMRFSWDTYINSTGSIAREMYIFDADPRNTEDLLGKEGRTLDNNTFYLTAPFITRYQTIKDCNILLDAVADNSFVTTAQRNGYVGFANTMKGLMLLQELARLGSNGIRIDVSDPENLGPFVSESEGYAAILDILQDGYDALQSGEFHFQLSSGFAGFDDPANFARFNRAVAARAALYAGDYPKALTFIQESFFDLNGDLFVGPKMVFSTASGDILNPVFRTPDQNGNQLVVHNDIITGILPNDTRIDKFKERINPTSQDGLNGTHETALYASSTSPVDIIRNEELILIYAEANIQTGKEDDAVNAFNIIRAAYDLEPYSGPLTEAALIDELLYHRTYSFWGEGHRMFDLRRYGRLNDTYLSIDRPGDQIFTEFPKPLSEN